MLGETKKGVLEFKIKSCHKCDVMIIKGKRMSERKEGGNKKEKSEEEEGEGKSKREIRRK